jgi:hypothetical protein
MSVHGDSPPSPDPAPEIGGIDVGTSAELRAQQDATAAAAASLATVRSSAEKWQAAIASILGLLGVSGLITGPDDFLKVQEQWRWPIPILLGLTVVLALAGVVLAARAAHGLPTRGWSTGEAFVERQHRAAQSAANALWAAIACALAAFVLLSTTVGIIWFAPRADAVGPAKTLIATETFVACGPVTAMTGPGIRLHDELTDTDVSVAAVDLRLLQEVRTCPKP